MPSLSLVERSEGKFFDFAFEAFFSPKALRGFLLKVCLKGSKAELENWKTVFGSNTVKVQFSGFVLGSFLFSFFQRPPKVSSACWKHVFIHVLTVEEDKSGKKF